MKDKLAEQKLEKVILHGKHLLTKNGLKSWTIKINNKRTTLATTWHDDKTITCSKYFLLQTDKEQFDGVMCHEIAHALLGKGRGHQQQFVDLCKKISPTHNYTGHETNICIGKYLYTCPRCGHQTSSNRGVIIGCSKCYEENASLVQLNRKRNYTKVVDW